MEIIAKTEDGYLIQANRGEVEEILKSVAGKRPEKIEIGQKIPAYDYSSTIVKVKSLKEDYRFKNMLSGVENFIDILDVLKKAVSEANEIDI